ncbi:MAG: DegV family protein [Candidatus Izemoplasmatales bacterium]|nr:DegV family protein [Candidatus Izemoplasmatales bacterium]
MKKVKIISDSTCDLSKELIEDCEIEIVPLYVNFEEESYLDGVDLNVEQMYDFVSKKKILPKTAAPSPGAFALVFQKYLDEGYEIIYLGIGSKFSATFSSANVAKQTLESDDIYLIDSLNLSSGTGLLLLKACKMVKQGLGAKEIKEKIEEIVPKIRSQFVIDTLEYLYKGGRLNALSALVGGMLRVKPIIKVRDGVMVVGKKGRGTIKNGINIMLNEVFQEKDNIDNEFMMITHSLADESSTYIKEQIKNEIEVKNLYDTHAGCVISSHCGKGTIGVLYILK